MIDLTKIDKPFGELDEVTQAALKWFAQEGRVIQHRPERSDDWYTGKTNKWQWYPGEFYRLAPPEPVKETRSHREMVYYGKHGGAVFCGDVLDRRGKTPGTATVDLIDGKPVRIVWEADDQ